MDLGTAMWKYVEYIKNGKSSRTDIGINHI
jgi:hypothetical protein